jgi:hypothetical protein
MISAIQKQLADLMKNNLEQNILIFFVLVDLEKNFHWFLPENEIMSARLRFLTSNDVEN